MIKTKKKQNAIAYWFSIGLIGQLISSPNATVMKSVLGTIDPTTFNTLRAGICALVAIPFMIWFWRKLNKQNAVYAIGAGLCTSVSVTATTYAIQSSQASYVVILGLLSPITLILFSSYFFHEKVKLRAAAGVTLAALGAFVAVAVPITFGTHTTFTWYPLATGLMLLANILLPLATILLRKANEAGLPLTSTQGISATIVMLTSFAATYAIHGGNPIDLTAIPTNVWIGIIYSAVIVIFIARIMTTASYEHIGSVATSAFGYLGTIVALIIPIIFLHEHLSIAMVVGGIIILAGVYLTEQHRSKHAHHKHLPIHHSVGGH